MVLRLMSCSPRRPAIGFTHLETRLKNRDLDDPRFWKRLYYGPSANVDKTRVFRTGRPLMKRCVHEIAGDRAFLPPPPREYGFVMPGRANKTSARLDASVGASGPHDFAVRESISRLRAGYRSQVSSTRPAIPSRARRCPRPRSSNHGCPWIQTSPNKATVMLDLIWGVGKPKYFCIGDWTAQISLICLNKLGFRRILPAQPRRLATGEITSVEPSSRIISRMFDDGAAVPFLHQLQGRHCGRDDAPRS